MKTKRLSTFSLLLVLLVSCDIIPLPPKVTPNHGLNIDNREFSFSADGGSAVSHIKGYSRWDIICSIEYLYSNGVWIDLGCNEDEWIEATLSDDFDSLSGSWYTAYKPKNEEGQYVNELHIIVSRNETGERRRVLIGLSDGPDTDKVIVTQEAE